MRCDLTLPWLATGGPLRRWRARRHAARCPRCSLVANDLRRIADELGEAPPLAPPQRALWVQAMGEPRPARSSWRPALAVSAIAAVILAVVTRPVSPPVHRPPSLMPPVPSPLVVRDLAALRADLDALSDELADLRRRADLLDAMREADALLARYAPPDPLNGF